jgi:hypothetical protein
MRLFRPELYHIFTHLAETLMVGDALCSTTTARSLIDFSLEACPNRQNCSAYAAIDKFFQIPESGKRWQ